MFLPVRFIRWKGPNQPQGTLAIGDDTSSSPSRNLDNIYQYIPVDDNARRLIVGYTPPSGSTSVTGQMYVYNYGSSAWLAYGSLKTITAGASTYFDTISSVDNSGDPAAKGSLLALVIADPNGVANGRHVFSIGVEGTVAADASSVSTASSVASLDAKLPSWLASSTISLVGTTGAVIKASTGRLKRIAVETQNQVTTEYLLVFDKATAPVNGDVPVEFTRIPSITAGPSSGPLGVFCGDTGRVFTNGIAYAVSTTLGTLTLPSASNCMVSWEYV